MTPKHAFASLVAVAREVSFVEGAKLVRQGEEARGAFLIRTGTAEAHIALPGGGMLNVARFSDGDIFGEMSLIERGVVSATVVAASNIDAWFVGRDDFRAVVASRSGEALAMQRTITHTLAGKLGALNERIRDFPAMEDRVAHEPVPVRDPLAGVPRSLHAAFEWRSFIPVLPFFAGFDTEEIDELVAIGKVLELPRGRWVFAAGLAADACYLVVRGALEVFVRAADNERRVAIAAPGELVGFMGMLGSGVHSANARVREDCCLLELPREPFVAICDGNSGTTVSLHQTVHRHLIRSLSRTNVQLTRLITHARLAATAGASELESALHGQIWKAADLSG